MKGGIGINRLGQTPVGLCTTGFLVKRTDTSELMLLTAGHCIQVHGGYNAAWEHSFTGCCRARDETWEPGGSGDADVGLMWLNDATKAAITNKNRIRRHNTAEGYLIGYSSPIQNAQACRVGFTSGHTCGIITDPDQENVSSVSGWQPMDVLHTARVNFHSLGGDSGGPVFWYPGGSTCCGLLSVMALGTHVHSEEGAGANEGWFSPYQVGRDDFNALPQISYTYNLCLSATC